MAETGLRVSDRVALTALASALARARAGADQRPAFTVVASSLSELGVTPAPPRPSPSLVETGRDDWLRRLRSGSRSESLLRAYRNAIDDLLIWSAASTRTGELFEEATIVAYLDDYRRRCSLLPRPTTAASSCCAASCAG